MTDTGPGVVKGHPLPPCLNPFNTSVSLPLQAPPPWLSVPSQMGGDRNTRRTDCESHSPGRTSGWATRGLRDCSWVTSPTHPRLRSLSSKMRMLTPSPFPGRLDHWEQGCEVESHRRHRASSFCTPLLPPSASVYQGLAISPRGRPSPTTN